MRRGMGWLRGGGWGGRCGAAQRPRPRPAINSPLEKHAHDPSFEFIVTFAFSKREIGQPALAAFAAAINFAGSTPGIFATTSRWDSVIIQPASVLSNVIVAVVWLDSGVMPTLPSS